MNEKPQSSENIKKKFIKFFLSLTTQEKCRILMKPSWSALYNPWMISKPNLWENLSDVGAQENEVWSQTL